ncbi:ATP-binding protein, partial [Acinetobacter baumannii]
MAHTADDVAESAMMRAGDAPGLGHLREWSPSPAWPEGRGVFLLRPLLEVRREALRAWLRDHAIAWFDDP